MDLLQIFNIIGILSIAVIIIGLFILNKTNTFISDEPSYTEQELDNIKLAQELYDKELRLTAIEKAPKTVDEELVSKATGTDETYIPVENSTEPIKPKKKRKYYPKKPKTSI
jgi:hypothetical protein